jgi:opacity protein-like surface antigen
MVSVLRNVSLALTLVLCFIVHVAQAQEGGPVDDASQPEGPEIYGALFLFGSLAQNRNLNVGGEELPSTTVKNGAGGGFKAGVFPAFTGYVVGIQGESFAMGHGITAPTSIGPSGTQSASGTMLAWTTMVSLVVRYPGEWVQPYIGVGAGWSSSFLVDTQITKGGITQSGTARDTSFASQYFGGLRINLTQGVFLFGEYKYFVTRFNWNGSLQPSLDFRTNIVAIGAGLTF